MKLLFILFSLFTVSLPSSFNSFINQSKIHEEHVDLTPNHKEGIIQNQSLGKWKYNGSDFPKSTFEIKFKNSQYICIVTFLDDRSSSTEKLTKIGTQRFSVTTSRTGEYYKINSKNGQLEMWDQDGLFIIASKIQ